MEYLTKADLQTHIYGENINAITRGDDGIVTRAINAAIAEAKCYLARYNVDALFNAEADNRDENLANKVKDLAAWHLVKLANPNINLELFRTAYEDAIDWLKGIMRGQAQPYGWPLRVDNPDTDYIEGGPIQWASNKKRENYL